MHAQERVGVADTAFEPHLAPRGEIVEKSSPHWLPDIQNVEKVGGLGEAAR